MAFNCEFDLKAFFGSSFKFVSLITNVDNNGTLFKAFGIVANGFPESDNCDNALKINTNALKNQR